MYLCFIKLFLSPKAKEICNLASLLVVTGLRLEGPRTGGLGWAQAGQQKGLSLQVWSYFWLASCWFFIPPEKSQNVKLGPQNSTLPRKHRSLYVPGFHSHCLRLWFRSSQISNKNIFCRSKRLPCTCSLNLGGFSNLDFLWQRRPWKSTTWWIPLTLQIPSACPAPYPHLSACSKNSFWLWPLTIW